MPFKIFLIFVHKDSTRMFHIKGKPIRFLNYFQALLHHCTAVHTCHILKEIMTLNGSFDQLLICHHCTWMGLFILLLLGHKDFLYGPCLYCPNHTFITVQSASLWNSHLTAAAAYIHDVPDADENDVAKNQWQFLKNHWHYCRQSLMYDGFFLSNVIGKAKCF